MPSTSRRIKGRDRLIVLATGSEATAQSGTPTYVAQGGGGGPVATKLAIITQPAGAVDAAAFTTQPVIEVQSAASVPVLQAGVVVTASIVSGAGTTVGTVTATTASDGRATFATLGIDASAPPASFTLRFTAIPAGLTQVDSSSFTVSAASGSAPDFFLDWRTGPGSTDAILRQNNKASDRWGGTSALFVESAAGYGMPAAMQYVLNVPLGTGTFDWVMMNNQWTAPAIGQWRYFRLYFRLVVGSAVSAGFAATHPMESEGAQSGVGGLYYALHVGGNADGSFPWMFDIGGFGHQWTTPNWTGGAPGTLTKNTTYRLEWAFLRTATSAVTLDMRLAGSDDSTIINDKNSLQWWGGGSLAANGTNQPVDVGHMEDLRLGINGGSFSSGNLIYGGFATKLSASASDWLGAYTTNG